MSRKKVGGHWPKGKSRLRGGPLVKRTSVSLSEADLERIERWSKVWGIKRSGEVLRQALEKLDALMAEKGGGGGEEDADRPGWAGAQGGGAAGP